MKFDNLRLFKQKRNHFCHLLYVLPNIFLFRRVAQKVCPRNNQNEIKISLYFVSKKVWSKRKLTVIKSFIYNIFEYICKLKKNKMYARNIFLIIPMFTCSRTRNLFYCKFYFEIKKKRIIKFNRRRLPIITVVMFFLLTIPAVSLSLVCVLTFGF